jgi:hypothetical protein
MCSGVGHADAGRVRLADEAAEQDARQGRQHKDRRKRKPRGQLAAWILAQTPGDLAHGWPDYPIRRFAL